MGVLIWEALSNSEIPYSSTAKDEDVTQKKLSNERLPQPQVCDRQLWVTHEWSVGIRILNNDLLLPKSQINYRT